MQSQEGTIRCRRQDIRDSPPRSLALPARRMRKAGLQCGKITTASTLSISSRGKEVATGIIIGRFPYPAGASARPGIRQCKPPARSINAASWSWRSSASARSPRLSERSGSGLARGAGHQRRCNAPVRGGPQGKADRQRQTSGFGENDGFFARANLQSEEMLGARKAAP
jgi:hypothetical protein